MMLLALAAALAVAGDGQSRADCLRIVGRQLERSGDPAQDIAAATIVACERTELKPGSLFPKMDFAHQQILLDRMRHESREAVVLDIERVRACRKTPGCSIADLP